MMPAITQPGLISGQQLGNAIFQFLPSLPGEGPPFMPRVLARTLFPRGFVPFAVAPVAPPVPLIQPPAPAPPVPALDVRGNQILRRQEMPAAIPQPTRPAPRKRVLERGSFPEWH